MTPSVAPIKPGDRVRRPGIAEIFVAVSCVWEPHYHAWDVTAARHDGSLIGEFAHNLVYVPDEEPDPHG